MVTKRNSEPLYAQVRAVLAREIASGKYPPGSALPNERDLAQAHDVSIGTLRAAVDTLVSEGSLIRQQGKGTFVAQHDRDRLRFYFFHVVEHEGERTHYPEVGLVQFVETKADAVIAAKLQVPRAAKVFHLRNLIRLDGAAVIVDDIWLDSTAFRGITEMMIRQRPSTLYQLYQEKFGRTVVRSLERLRASACAEGHARLLGIPTDAPVLQIRRQAVAYDGSPVEWRVSTVNTARHEYTSDLGS
jgi:GntR family transcriptional regulator